MSESFFKHPTALVESDQVGEKTNVWAYAHVMKGAVIGRRCNIGDHAFVESGAVVGDEVTIKNGVAVWQYVTVKDRVFLGPNCSLTNDNRPRSKREWSPVPTVIEEGATVGANATIVCGCDIGRYAFIGAGAVVTRPVPDYAVVFGNPGRVHGYVCECCQPLKGKGGLLSCEKCGLTYVKTGDGVRKADTAQAAAGSGQLTADGPKRKAVVRKRAEKQASPKRGVGQASPKRGVGQASPLVAASKRGVRRS